MARDQKVKNKATQPAGKGNNETISPMGQQQNTTAVAAQSAISNTVTSVAPIWPTWPTSKPGPQSTPPPPGMRPFNRYRPEQLVEIGYNQETGEPENSSPLRSLPDASLADSVSFDQQSETGQDKLGKRKKRL